MEGSFQHSECNHGKIKCCSRGHPKVSETVNYDPIICFDNLCLQSNLSRPGWTHFVDSFYERKQSELLEASTTMNQASPAVVLDTVEAYLNYKPRGVERARNGSSSSKTTIPKSPRKDVVNIRVWEDFPSAVAHMYAEL
jgi:hypothetical protein